jgi:hypothetical protein
MLSMYTYQTPEKYDDKERKTLKPFSPHPQRDYTIPRVPQCLPLRPNWVRPPPLSQASGSPPREPKEGGNTRLRVRGWGIPVQTTGEKAWHFIFSPLPHQPVPPLPTPLPPPPPPTLYPFFHHRRCLDQSGLKYTCLSSLVSA